MGRQGVRWEDSGPALPSGGCAPDPAGKGRLYGSPGSAVPRSGGGIRRPPPVRVPAAQARIAISRGGILFPIPAARIVSSDMEDISH
ncbi:MAG: hypothetical protein N3A38_11405, partial [Planctomycetota bacterium]|nr:hypothetical protein [Planctomycetota bacterium]